MIRRTLAFVATGMLAFSLLGCSSAGPVTLTEADDGRTQQLAVGQELQVSLEANPTTGYRWAIDGDLPPELEQVGEPEYKADSSAIGSGGRETWIFSAVKSGSAALRLKYWRSFEPTVEPVATFSASVMVE